MVRAHTLMAAIALIGLANIANAQTGYYPYSPYGVYGGGHASTAAEGAANGMSNIIQSAGQYNLNTSQAAINAEQARSMDLDNRLKGTQTYFEMRKTNSDAQKAEQPKGLTTEDSWRYAQMYVPKRLSPVQLDPVTGRIYWPIMLQDPRYATLRKPLDQLFVQRETSHGGIGYETYMQIQASTDALIAELKKNINQYKDSDYIQIKNFVESLAYEAKFPAV